MRIQDRTRPELPVVADHRRGSLGNGVQPPTALMLDDAAQEAGAVAAQPATVRRLG
jgi:hypothetical protein